MKNIFTKFVCCLLIALANATVAAEKRYGSFVFSTEVPNTLFFFDDIKPNDSFEMRKALRNHDIENIVLASPGGSVFEGLQMAGIIFDKKLRTYIPRKAVCASACSYLFFAGNERLADGELGVHQAYSANANQKEAIGQTQYVTQFTVSEIIGFLNEFGTPAFVYERMFQDVDMYFFDEIELMQLNSSEFSITQDDKIAIAQYASSQLEQKAQEKKNQENKPEERQLSEKEIIALIQQKLNEIGCNAGVVDGIWGARTNAAAVRFAKKAGLPTAQAELISDEFFDKLSKTKSGFCPKPNKGPQIRFARKYKMLCDGLDMDIIASVSKVDPDLQKFAYTVEGIPIWLFWDGDKLDDRVNMMRDGKLFLNQNNYVYRFEYTNVGENLVCTHIVLTAITQRQN